MRNLVVAFRNFVKARKMLSLVSTSIQKLIISIIFFFQFSLTVWLTVCWYDNNHFCVVSPSRARQFTETLNRSFEKRLFVIPSFFPSKQFPKHFRRHKTVLTALCMNSLSLFLLLKNLCIILPVEPFLRNENFMMYNRLHTYNEKFGAETNAWLHSCKNFSRD